MGQEDLLHKEWLSLKQDRRISKCRSAYVVSDWGLGPALARRDWNRLPRLYVRSGPGIGDSGLGISAIRYSLLVAGHSLLVTDCCTLITACRLLVTDLLLSPFSHSVIRNLKSAFR